MIYRSISTYCVSYWNAWDCTGVMIPHFALSESLSNLILRRVHNSFIMLCHILFYSTHLPRAIIAATEVLHPAVPSLGSTALWRHHWQISQLQDQQTALPRPSWSPSFLSSEKKTHNFLPSFAALQPSTVCHIMQLLTHHVSNRFFLAI